MKQYPAIDVGTDAADFLLAIVDDFGPTAVEERGRSVRIFFATAGDRDGAQHALAAQFDVSAIEVDDEDWARRSQENLKPVTVGRITVAPPWATGSAHLPTLSRDRSALDPEPSRLRSSPIRESSGVARQSAEGATAAALRIVILPSMGFGTGHHATTRLCLAALQAVDLAGRDVLDVGTGSGVLAIAADRLGATRAIGIDVDPDAIQSARDNLDLNPDARHVTFETIDLAARELPAADVVTANLTAALLIRAAGALLGAVRSGGILILSGIQSHERDDVGRAFAKAEVCWERDEDGWVGIAVKKP